MNRTNIYRSKSKYVFIVGRVRLKQPILIVHMEAQKTASNAPILGLFQTYGGSTKVSHQNDFRLPTTHSIQFCTLSVWPPTAKSSPRGSQSNDFVTKTSHAADGSQTPDHLRGRNAQNNLGKGRFRAMDVGNIIFIRKTVFNYDGSSNNTAFHLLMPSRSAFAPSSSIPFRQLSR